MLRGKYWRLVFSVLLLIFGYLEFTLWRNQVLAWIFLLMYLVLFVPLWQTILRRVLAIDTKNLLSKVLAGFVLFTILGLTTGIFIIFYKIDYLVVWLVYLITAFLTGLFYKVFNKRVKEKEFIDDEEIVVVKNKLFTKLLVVAYLILWVVGFYLLYKSQSTVALYSPWQAISQYYLPIFFVLTCLSGIFLLVKFKTKTILFLLVLQTLLLHLYLPLSQVNPWGGDVWRHVAMEEIITGGEKVLPLISASKLAYSHLWGISVFLNKALSLNLLTINKWLMPILWSLMAPFLWYRIGALLFDSRRKGLWLAWLALLPFSLQALGSLALPVSFDFLFFLFVIMLWLQYWREHYPSQKYLALFFSVLSIFIYSLYAVLLWLVIVGSLIFHYLFRISNSLLRKSLLTVFIFLSSLTIPIIELFAKIDFVPEQINWWQNLKQFFGQFSGWFYAGLIRPHDILSGNFIFNHTPDYAFVSNIFNVWRWWLIPALLIIWILVFFGLYQAWGRADKRWRVINLLFFTVFVGYLIGWFVLQGERLFTRRLDMVLAFLILVLLIEGITYLLSKFQVSNFKFKIITLIIILGLSWFTTFTYTSGPDMRVVSETEYQAAEYLNQNLINKSPSCVLADTWVLLPLETLSSRQIVGGGFPIDNNFAQPELTVLYNEMLNNPRENVLQLAHKLTRTESCWYAGVISNELQVESSELFGEPVQFGDLAVWQEVKITTSTPTKLPLKKASR